jgi:hypothetical protein
MLREAVRPNRGRAARGSAKMIPAPVAGLNLRDSIASMKPDDALVLDNIFPETTYCRIRRGFTEWATDLPAAAETLMEWSGPTRSFFAATGTEIYDITAGGAVGAAVETGLTNARWQHLMFSNAGGNYLVAVNGADGVLTYDGTTWAIQTITGATATDFFQIASWKRRLWFAEFGSPSVWYLGADAISGAATELNLGGVWRNGGTLARIVSASYDTTASGAQDAIGFLSTNGELALYQGTDPASATTFWLAGVYQMGVPVGDRSSYQSGGDTVLITNDGVLSMLEMMRVGDRSAAPRASITDRIALDFIRDVELYGQNFGWQLIGYPAGHMALVNVPTSGSTSRQWVMNTITGAWCKFTRHNASCWGLFNNALYFADKNSGTIYRADSGRDDNGAVIPWALKGSFQPAGNVAQLKKMTMMQPIVRTNGTATFGVGVDVDYGDASPDSIFNSQSAAAIWDVDLWDVGVWGGPQMVQDWIAVNGIGRVVSVMMRGSTIGVEMQINAYHLITEPAPGLAL